MSWNSFVANAHREARYVGDKYYASYVGDNIICLFDYMSAVLWFLYASIFQDSRYFSCKCSAVKDDHKANLKHPWQAVQEKLFDSLDAIEHGSNLGNGVEFEQKQAACPLSLFAISEGPKLRLLWASFHQLEKEAGTVNFVSFSVLTIVTVYFLSLTKFWAFVF